ncbi:FAD-dependent oxidoreductase [Polyangium mundeleinium]|uniref:FAD-dependent oxidoreductase n=1 Tax=Polyangium mundeleinium TaxID=2995306 RepID=A0ABT5F8A6_9BACT|nr:FAD-dependent oxidoreductase [Polyangium mundeleinium]MDC0749335.1 FAD-dependent oxidoreductase [Polyangium mundeleinium]
MTWHYDADVVIVGAGGAALAAAVAAVHEGVSVLLLEAGPQPGGTASISGGAFWIPNNSLMRAQGLTDPRPDALKLMARLSYPSLYDPAASHLGLPKREYDLLAAFYDHGSDVIDELTQLGALFPIIYPGFGFSPSPISDPDYHAGLPENVSPYGRVLGNAPPGLVGWPGYLLTQSMIDWIQAKHVPIRTNHRVVGAIQKKDGEVVGVEIEHNGARKRARARRAVVFATGGFSHARGKVLGLQRGPLFGTGSVPTGKGDFLDIAASLDAAIGNLSNGFYFQLAIEEAAAQNGHVTNVGAIAFGVYGDSTILVNKYGRRCVNEKMPYHVRAQSHFLALGTDEPNLVQFMIWDEAVAQEPTSWPWRGVVPAPGTLPPFVIKANTRAALAAAIDARLNALRGQRFAASGVVPSVKLDPNFVTNLDATIARFNGFAATGMDLDFQRGATSFENAWQGPSRSVTANRTMYPMSASGPYYAVILGAGTLDTCGGPIVGTDGRVLRPDGTGIPGLFGAGNCIASPAGRGYWGAGGTIGPALVFGFLAGKKAAHEPVHPL